MNKRVFLRLFKKSSIKDQSKDKMNHACQNCPFKQIEIGRLQKYITYLLTLRVWYSNSKWFLDNF